MARALLAPSRPANREEKPRETEELTILRTYRDQLAREIVEIDRRLASMGLY